MKDAKGHGSDTRYSFNDPTVNDRLKRREIGMTIGAHFSDRPLSPNLMPSAAQKTVNDLRNRMQTTGPGHFAALGQAVKNLLG